MCIQVPRALIELQEFSRFHFEALQNAALLLAGHFALKRIQSVLDDIFRATTVTRRMQLDVIEVHKLLSLHYVNDPERIEAAYFAEIEMNSPYVEDICLMTEALTDILLRLDLDPGQPLEQYLLAA
jgi:hypothetical protein